MTLASAAISSPLTTDEHGVVRVGNTRVMLERIVHAFDAGASAEEIVESYPTLNLADVYATIAFILRNRADVDSYMTESRVESERLHREAEQRFSTSELRRRIRERAAVA